MLHRINERILNLSLREKILILIFTGLIFITFVLHVVIPQIKDYRHLQKQVLIDQQKIISVNKQITAWPGEKNDMEKAQAKWHGYEKYFSQEVNDGTILEIIGSIAEGYNLQLLSFTLQEPVDKRYYCEFPVDFVVMGDWSKVITFVEQIEHQQNLTEIKNMNIVVSNINYTRDKAKAKISLVVYMKGNILLKKDEH